MKRFAVASLAVLAFAIVLPLGAERTSADATGRFVGIAGTPYPGSRTFMALTESGEYWQSDDPFAEWRYRGVIGPGPFIAIAGASGGQVPATYFIALTERGDWWWTYWSFEEWRYGGVIGPGPFVSIAGTSVNSIPNGITFLALTQSGEWWRIDYAFEGGWHHGGVIGGATAVEPSTWGQIKAQSRGR